MYRERQIKVWFAAHGAKLHLFLWNSPVWCFFDVFWKFVIFFGTPMAQKKSANLFSLKIQSSEKQFFKNWIIESQKIPKIVIRKFTIFSSGIMFSEKLFFNGS